MNLTFSRRKYCYTVFIFTEKISFDLVKHTKELSFRIPLFNFAGNAVISTTSVNMTSFHQLVLNSATSRLLYSYSCHLTHQVLMYDLRGLCDVFIQLYRTTCS